MVHMTLSRTLLEDLPAMEFLGRGYWDEMLRVAGGIPAEDPMVQVIIADTQLEDVGPDQVYVHIIGYAEPAMPAEEVMRHRVEPHMPTYSLSELIAQIGDVARAQAFNYDEVVNALVGQQVSINGPWTQIREVDDDQYRYRQPTEYDFITRPQHYGDDDENWEYGDDVAKWYHEMEEED
jgi:hypothetical protein